MVVRELLDPPQVLHEQFLRRRRDEPLELPFLPDRIDEVKTAREHGEEAEEGFPYHVLADRMMDRLQPIRALRRREVLGEGKDHPEDPEGEEQGAELVAELAENTHGGRGQRGGSGKALRGGRVSFGAPLPFSLSRARPCSI